MVGGDAGARAGAGGAGVAGSDAERRAALGLAARLRDGGRAVTVETEWVRPRWEVADALHAGLGVLASVVAVGAPVAGLALALVALASLLLDLAGRGFLLRRLTPERATQNVIADAPTGGAAQLRVILTAHCDVPRGGLLHRLARRGTNGPPPGPFAWLALALVGVAVCAAIRLAGSEGTLLGAIQLVPSLVLVVALGLLVDAALAGPVAPAGRVAGDTVLAAPIAEAGETALAAPGAPASAAAGDAALAGPAARLTAADVVLAAAQALDAAPPRRLAIEVVIAGTGEGQALGFLAYLRHRRPAPERNVVIEVAGPDAAPAPTWWTSDAALLPLRYHPRLVALAAAAAAEEPHLGARPRRGRAIGAALRARQRRIPAIRLAATDPADALALTLALVELLDEDRD
jgi:hypothetical protein